MPLKGNSCITFLNRQTVIEKIAPVTERPLPMATLRAMAANAIRSEGLAIIREGILDDQIAWLDPVLKELGMAANFASAPQISLEILESGFSMAIPAPIATFLASERVKVKDPAAIRNDLRDLGLKDPQINAYLQEFTVLSSRLPATMAAERAMVKALKVKWAPIHHFLTALLAGSVW